MKGKVKCVFKAITASTELAQRPWDHQGRCLARPGEMTRVGREGWSDQPVSELQGFCHLLL